MRQHLFLTWSVLSLVGCAETARTCPEGFWRPAGSDVCQPITDGGSFDAATDSGPSDGDVPDDAGPCGPCTDMSLPWCDETTGACVQCRSGSDCADPTPSCDMGTRRCVQCTVDAECTEPGAARCDAGACVPCTGSSQCTEPDAARCEAGACVPCTGSSQCEGIGATLVCDPGVGECVTCHGSEVAACEVGHPCTMDNVCSAYPDDRLACQACDTDANCAEANHLCVPMSFGGMPRGGYCLQKYLGVDCPRPFSMLISMRTSLSGETGFEYCGIDEAVTTCEAVRALRENASCADGLMCPEGGLCRRVSGLLTHCTYLCGSTADCLPTGAGSSCGVGDGAPPTTYCGG